MGLGRAVSLVLYAHFPFAGERAVRAALDPRAADGEFAEARPRAEADPTLDSAEESLFFESISETLLPLLGVLDRLEGDRVPCRLGLALSPLMGQALGDAAVMGKYAAHLDRRIDFGERELRRLDGSGPLAALAARYLDRAIDARAALATRYDGGVLGALGARGRGERVEILAAPATGAFLPFLCGFPESIQAQIEVGLSFCRYWLGANPRGLWLPGLGWAAELDGFLRAYGMGYTIAESHGLVMGDPPPARGVFFPVRTPQGVFALGRDRVAAAEIADMRSRGPYRDNGLDAGHELGQDIIAPFIARNWARCHTGHKYWRASPSGGERVPYDAAEAEAAAAGHARAFLESVRGRLDEAARLMRGPPISVCAFEADDFGLRWHEGPVFLENLFRAAAVDGDVRFVTPSEYLGRRSVPDMEESVPEFSSWGENGYAERWLDSSGDWIYRHLGRACERMVELTERFHGDSWVRERALNQAARELLLAQSADWPELMRRPESRDFARRGVEDALRNFNAIYEAMNSSHISTEWLTDLESRRGIFPDVNYRVFRRKS